MSKTRAKSFEWEKNINYAAWALIALLCLIYLFRTNEIIHYTGGDDAFYILLAKSIIAGEGYRDSFMASQPANVHFPPMFPLMLAGVVAIFGANSFIMKLIVSFAAAASLVLSYVLARRMKFAWPFVAAVWMGFCFRFFNYTDLLLSETVFMAFTLGGMLAFDKWLEKEDLKFAAITIVCCWIAEMTRTAGITIPVALGAAIFLKKGRSKKAALTGLAAFVLLLVPLVLWSIRNKMVSDVSTSYLSQFLAVDPYDPTKGLLTPTGLIKRFFNGLKYYFVDTAGMIRPLDEDIAPVFLNLLLAFIFWALVVAGFIRKAIEDAGVTEVFVAAFTGMVIIWPFLSYRFLLPAYPLLFMYAAHGAHSLTGLLSKALKNAGIAVCSLLFMVVIVMNLGEMIKYQKFINGIKYREVRIARGMYAFSSYNQFDQLLKASLWLAANGQKNSVIMTRKPSLVALAGAAPVTGVPIPPPENPWKWVKEHQIRYILIDQIAPDALRFMQALSNGQAEVAGIRIIYNSDKTYVVEVNPELLK